MSPLQLFCRQVRRRSQEHRAAVSALTASDLHGQVVSVLRQELDSLVRVIYLLSIGDQPYRSWLINASVEGQRWTQKGTNKTITDRAMVDLAQSLQGWTQSVYKLGCAFIHLSSFHDYQERDPFEALPVSEQEDILRHLRYYHGGPIGEALTFKALIPYLPRVFDKVASNLACYVDDLERGGSLDDEDGEP